MSSTDFQWLMLDVAKGFRWCVKEPKGEFFDVLAFGCVVLRLHPYVRYPQRLIWNLVYVFAWWEESQGRP